MREISHLATRLLNKPLLCEPNYLEVVLSVLGPRLNLEPTLSTEQTARYRRAVRAPFIDKSKGIAVIPIVGGLVHRSDSINPESGMTGYTAIQNLISEVMDNPIVRGILLDVDSPGGEVPGVAETADFITNAAKELPIYAISNSLMASAAYWLSASALKIFATPFSNIGSIGVYVAHLDRSKELEKRGQKVTFIKAGDHKTDGNSFEPLADDVRERIQAGVDELYNAFVDVVSQRRALSPAKVRATQAGVFSPEQAKQLGLIDGVATFGRTLEIMAQDINRSHLRAVSSV